MDGEGSFFDERGDYKVREAKGAQPQQNPGYQPQNPNADYHYNQTIAGRPVYVQVSVLMYPILNHLQFNPKMSFPLSM